MVGLTQLAAILSVLQLGAQLGALVPAPSRLPSNLSSPPQLPQWQPKEPSCGDTLTHCLQAAVTIVCPSG